jgi:hypothetical protein
MTTTRLSANAVLVLLDRAFPMGTKKINMWCRARGRWGIAVLVNFRFYQPPALGGSPEAIIATFAGFASK